MVSIARRNMFHEKGRFAVTALGIAASIMLILFGVGMAVGIWDSMVTVVDHSSADIWVLNSQNVDLAQAESVLPENLLTQIQAVTGVKSAAPLIYSPSIAERAGAKQTVEIVGVDTTSGLVLPWNLGSGSINSLNTDNSVIVDESAQIREYLRDHHKLACTSVQLICLVLKIIQESFQIDKSGQRH